MEHEYSRAAIQDHHDYFIANYLDLWDAALSKVGNKSDIYNFLVELSVVRPTLLKKNSFLKKYKKKDISKNELTAPNIIKIAKYLNINDSKLDELGVKAMKEYEHNRLLDYQITKMRI